ncbi:YidC/Oxa1 family membrane protein insertase [Staphylococcus hominis]|uniref:membrane protein insertase YidC n=1 Tax=Staphylococcus hominis TaxID=1290 RepID=UPI003F66C407
MKFKYILLLLLLPVFLSACNYSNPDNRNGFFYNSFAKPMDLLLNWLGTHLNHNYGLAIILIVLTIRLIMLPFMLSQTKNGQFMRKIMDLAQPEIKPIQEKIRHARTQEEKLQANQDMIQVYKKYEINPMKSMFGCLPVLIQMPVLFALYSALKWPVYNHLTQYPDFLWFKLSHPDIFITAIAGILYFLQSLVSLQNMPKEQKQVGYMMMIISPIFIVYISLSSSSALGLYWSISALFLVIQMYFSNKYFSKLAEQKLETLKIKNAPQKKKEVKTVKRKKK